jgi:hypothetical protein
MAKGRAATFEENRPTITEQEVWEAAQRDSLVLSFNALPVSKDAPKVDFLGVKMVLTDGTVKTVLFDQHSAVALCALVSFLSKGQWMMSQTSPSSGHMRQ